jgi:hypothetical protein
LCASPSRTRLGSSKRLLTRRLPTLLALPLVHIRIRWRGRSNGQHSHACVLVHSRVIDRVPFPVHPARGARRSPRHQVRACPQVHFLAPVPVQTLANRQGSRAPHAWSVWRTNAWSRACRSQARDASLAISTPKVRGVLPYSFHFTHSITWCSLYILRVKISVNLPPAQCAMRVVPRGTCPPCAPSFAPDV